MGGIFVAGGAVSSGITNIVSSITSSTSSGSSTAVGFPSGAPPPAGFSQQVLQNHLQKLNNRDVSGAAADYATNAVMVWSGNTQGLGGVYSGQGNIRLTLQTAIGSASALSYTIQSLNDTGSPSNSNVAGVKTTLNFAGVSAILGKLNGTIDATYVFVSSGGNWLIQQETSNYKVFNIQFAQGATTFPQWQITGPPLPQRYSESPFKNWVYFYGGAAAAISVAGYVSMLPIMSYIRKRRLKNSGNKTTNRKNNI
jgi:hypothetical protein